MAKKKQKINTAEICEDAPITDQPMTETVESNYMPYVMSVIIARAIPQIDGFKPSHRKILYTMYKMGLLTGQRTKSANVVGQTMKLNPHGDMAIYETLVRLTRGNESLLHPFVDSKGSFGKQYSSDMAFAASRYTEVKLAQICAEIFRGIDKNAVDFVPNYDNTMQEPVLLPTSFPNILVSPNMGIAVGMASRICSFNLSEICDGTIQILKKPDTTAAELLDIIKAPDFSGGGYLIYNREQLEKIYDTGRGPIKLRARYVYDKDANCIDIIQIPYSTTLELIMKKLTELVKDGRIRELTDFRDEIDVNGFKLTLDLKKGVNPDALMTKLFKLTPLEDDFSCNFNVLINNAPVQTGIVNIIKEWIIFRQDCVRRELSYELQKKRDKLHLLLGLGAILLDIDRAIKVVRETKNDSEVVPNLMDAFGIDEIQAEYIAEIKLRNLNKDYILERIKEIENLRAEIEDLTDLVGSEARLKSYIAKQLREIKVKYGQPRKTQLIYDSELADFTEEEQVENYNVKLILSKEGYFKKITLLSLRGNDEQKYKEGDTLRTSEDAENTHDVIFFSDRGQCYKSHIAVFECTKASALGDYIPAKLSFDRDEKCVFMKSITEYNDKHNLIFIFANGKGVKIPFSAYETKAARKKLTGAYSTASPLVGIIYESEPTEITIVSNINKAITINTSLIPVKSTRTSQGVTLFTLKKNQLITDVYRSDECPFANPRSYRRIKVPASGIQIDEHDIVKQQISLIDN